MASTPEKPATSGYCPRHNTVNDACSTCDDEALQAMEQRALAAERKAQLAYQAGYNAGRKSSRGVARPEDGPAAYMALAESAATAQPTRHTCHCGKVDEASGWIWDGRGGYAHHPNGCPWSPP